MPLQEPGAIYIDGAFVPPTEKRGEVVINPATEEAIGEVAVGGVRDADAAIAAAREAFDAGPWPRMSARERIACLQKMYDVLGARADEICELIVLEAGSVMLQVASFKLTGKRIFAMSPLHHHFELKGWEESTVTVRFWILSLLASLMALATLKLR